MVRGSLKREPDSSSNGGNENNSSSKAVVDNTVEVAANDHDDNDNQCASDRRVLRTRYLSLKNTITGDKDDIASVDSDKFQSIFNKVETLHQRVQKPREQVADAEVLLDITNTLVTSVKEQNSEGITVSDFVTCLLRDFGHHDGLSASSSNGGRNAIIWKDIGIAVSHTFRSCPGYHTMIGPMNVEQKQRKAIVHRKRVAPVISSRPEELNDSGTAERTDTDKNMATMFDILRKNRGVTLENLVLNRNSFAQTLENFFALSFLVKDGRAEIKIDDQGCHRVSPMNAPAANSVASGEVTYSHFVFRFDFKDWKLIAQSVEIGKELMPHRNQVNVSNDSQQQEVPDLGDSEATASTTPIRKLSRNRGLVLQEQSVVDDSSESDNTEARSTAIIRKGKRKLSIG